MFDLSKEDLTNAKLQVSYRTVYKGQLEEPETKDIPIQKCQLQENLDHEYRFKAIALFKKILTEFKKNLEGMQKEVAQFVEDMRATKSDSEFMTALIDTVDRQTA